MRIGNGSTIIPRRLLADNRDSLLGPGRAFGRPNGIAQPRIPRAFNSAVDRRLIEKQFSIIAIHQVDEALARKRFGDVERGITQAGELRVAHKYAVAPGVGGEAVPSFPRQLHQRAGRSARGARLAFALPLPPAEWSGCAR